MEVLIRGVCSCSTFRLHVNRNSAAVRTSGAARRSDIFCVKGFSTKPDENNKIAVSATLVAKMGSLVGLIENSWIRCVHWICAIEQAENGFVRQCFTIKLLNLHFVFYFEGRRGGDTCSPTDMKI